MPIKWAFFQGSSKSLHKFLPIALNCSAFTRILCVEQEVTTTGADMVSTEVANPEVHAEDSDYLVNPAEKL